MGGKNKKKDKNLESYPFVSICTPTYNRRPFIDSMIKCFMHQTYPRHRMEWIIIDDGTDKIGDLVKHIPQVKYYDYAEKMVLGKKRNLMHEKSNGDIIVYMDDDDYYPPLRVAHAVNMLITHPKALCAGSSEIYIWFKHIQQMVQFGPYGPNHATAGTFAFKKELLKDHRYDDTKALAEEKSFLKDYTVPFVQLEPKKTILVFSHEHNTFDKKTLLDNKHPQFVKDSDKMVDDFVKESNLKEFYMNEIEDLLKKYEPGRPDMKPDVIKQMSEIKIEREKMVQDQMQKQQEQMKQMQENPQLYQEHQLKQMQQNPQMMHQMMSQNQELLHQNSQIIHNNQQLLHQLATQGNMGQIMGEVNGQKTVLGNQQIVQILQQQQQEMHNLREIILGKDKIIEQFLSDE